MKLNLYLIMDDGSGGYDTYDSAVVAAETEEAARLMQPSGYGWTPDLRCGTWVRPEFVRVKLVGLADPSITEPRVICASFNAG